MKTFFVFILMFMDFCAIAQDQEPDTLCLSRARVGRIADSLHYYRIQSEMNVELQNQLAAQIAVGNNLSKEIAALNIQLAETKTAFYEQSKQSVMWQTAATDYKTNFDNLVPKFERKKKALRAWVGIGLAGIFCTAAATTIAILKK